MIQIILLALIHMAVAGDYGPAHYGSYGSPVPYSAPTYAAPAKAYVQEPHYPPEPYSFGYDVNDGYGGGLNQQETGDAYGNKKGSYGYKDAYGIYRQVDYVADDYGFRATIKTNEPGTANQDPASVKLVSSAPPVQYSPAPVYKASSYAAPAYAAPAYAAPAYAAPAPVYSAPHAYSSYSAPAYSEPVYASVPKAVYAPAPVYKAPVILKSSGYAKAGYSPLAAAYSIPSISYAKGY